jgi:hypothetical protein
MTMASELSLRLFDMGNGCAKCEVRTPDQSFKHSFSYTTDALGDIAWAALSTALQQREFHVLFDDEPTGYLWQFTQPPYDGPPQNADPFAVLLSIWSTGSASVTLGHLRDGRGWLDPTATKYFEAIVRGGEFARTVLDELERVKGNMIGDEFATSTGFNWPDQGVAALRKVLEHARIDT